MFSHDLKDGAARNGGELLELGVLRPVVETGCHKFVRVLADPDADFFKKVRVLGLVDDRNHIGDPELFGKPAGHQVDRVIAGCCYQGICPVNAGLF